VDGAVENSYGVGTGGSGIGDEGSGIYVANGSVHNCRGYSNGGGFGVYGGQAVENSYGQSISGAGLHSGAIAIGCVGVSSSGYGITTYIANSCYGQTTSGPAAVSASFKYNMP
jgi:hypothetical protein